MAGYPRKFTSSEKLQYRSVFPRLVVDRVIVTGPETTMYNCLAWTIGVTSSWLWLWGGLLPPKSEFDKLYNTFGYSPAAKGEIAVYGYSLKQMTHGSLFSSPYGRFESKCGGLARLIHFLPELEGNQPAYGRVLGYYTRTREVRFNLDKMKIEKIDDNERTALSLAVSAVPDEIKKTFKKLYSMWYATSRLGPYAMQSNPVALLETYESQEIIKLGKTAIPLVLKKILDGNFLALSLYDLMEEPEKIIRISAEDERMILGEQYRAILVLKKWVRENS